MNNESSIQLYSGDGSLEIQVELVDETVWLSQQQIAKLFESSRTNIVEHIKHIYEEGELAEDSTCRNFRQVQIEGTREVAREIPFYNLDMILSVGYRVKSKTATQFRIWATDILRTHLVDGYTRNQRRLNQLGNAVNILSRSSDEVISGIAGVLEQFSSGLGLLDSYDHQALTMPKGGVPAWELTYEEAQDFIKAMSFDETSDLFGVESNDSFKGIVAGLYQSFNDVELYPSIQEKAANLLYLIVKDHSFIDGNKRIAAALFVYFLEMNGALRTDTGQQVIDNNALAAITLMVALSAPEEKSIMCMLIINMLSSS